MSNSTSENSSSAMSAPSLKVHEFAVYHDEFINSPQKAEEQFNEINKTSTLLEQRRLLVHFSGDDSKNRYDEVKPYRHNRIKLCMPNDYINASKVCPKHCFFDSQPPCSCEDFYIAAQGPLQKSETNEETISDFWRMIVENNVDIIINLTGCTENLIHKCAQYWPSTVGDKLILQSYDEPIIVEMIDCLNSTGFYEERVFKVTMNSVERTVTQLHMLSWPDNCVPAYDDFLCMYKRFLNLKRNGFATLVHCSAGVGRTGSFILIDIILRSITSPNDQVDIYSALLELRKCRNFLVITKEQYIFVHSALFQCFVERGLVQPTQ